MASYSVQRSRSTNKAVCALTVLVCGTYFPRDVRSINYWFLQEHV